MRKLCNMYTMIHYSLFIFFFGGLATISFYRNNTSQGVAISNNFIVTPISYYSNNSSQGVAVSNNFNVTSTIASTCDLFSGRWVHDNKSHYPLYEEHECPYLDESYACQTCGRKDFKYQQWRWQPHDCDFPRFDGKAIVERLRGKRLMFVGDSLVRNQWNSMICMLYTSIPGVKRIGGELIGSLRTFRFTVRSYVMVVELVKR
ncbi:putative PMR5 domain, PC-Esterase [Helianthus debilis subsp. tardiflorus]